MSLNVIQGTARLAENIRSRRQELGLTIEEAASRAGVGTKTWCRYEAGESIRQDKAKGICRALNWRTMPGEENAGRFDLERYRHHKAWSAYLCDRFGEAAAISFVIGSDILLDHISEDMNELSRMPAGTHIGQIPVSMLQGDLPQQFLMRYDYEFLYQLKASVKDLRAIAHAAHRTGAFLAHTVMQEMLLYLIVEESRFLMESMQQEMEEHEVSGLDVWDEWAFDLFDDMDVVTYLYSGMYLAPDDTHHFEHWVDEQFYM